MERGVSQGDYGLGAQRVWFNATTLGRYDAQLVIQRR